ncbi:sensor histidine kinase [Clostridium sardiniense]|uniref:sensor histidine kinase n=1 Tax=Clostridium sardiniense TaxID=29369 RepID=UPI003D32C838
MVEENALFLIVSIFIFVYNILIINRLKDDLNFLSKINIYTFMTLTMLLSLRCIYYDKYIDMIILFFVISLNIVTLFTKNSKGVVLLLSGIIPINIINLQNIMFSFYELITNNSVREISSNIQSLNKTVTIVLYIAFVIITIRGIGNIIITNSEDIEKSFENEGDLGKKLIMIFFYMVNVGLVHYLYILDNYSRFSLFVALCSVINLLISWFIMRNAIVKGSAKGFEEKSDILNEQIKNQYNHYVELEKYYSEIFRIKHDMNNHNNIITVLLQNEEYDELKRYMNKYNENITDLESDILICKNKIIDAICLSKKSICKEKGIYIKFDIKVPEEISIDDLALCAIYGNLLDNAIEACDRISDKNRDKFIDIKSKISKGYLTIELINSKEDISIKKNNKFITLKKDKKYHGIGLKSIQRSVNKYKGEVILKDKGKVFETNIMVKCE